MAYVKDGKLPTAYKPQVQMSLYTTERKCWYFVSYNPEYDPLLIKVDRDEAFIKKISEALELFSVDLKNLIQEVKNDGKWF